jgi:hypothetical protein
LKVFGISPPYAIPAPTFLFPGLAARAARGQLGGDRELALAAFVAARLAAGTTGPAALPPAVRAARAQHARAYFAALSLPPAARVPFARLADAAAGIDAQAVAKALALVLDAAARSLNVAARGELETLGAMLDGAKSSTVDS